MRERDCAVRFSRSHYRNYFNMKQETTKIIFSLIRSAMSGTPISPEELALCSPEVISAALKLSSSHDLAHLVAWGAKKNGIVSAEGESAILKAVYRHQQLKYEYERLVKSLEEEKIPFLPLKGSVIRSRYPEPWMRTSSDIDILVNDTDIDAVKRLLTEGLKYKFKGDFSHDVAFFSPANVFVEMHFDLIEESVMDASAKIMKRVWDASAVKDGYTYFYEMPDELFYFYHVAHMAKHLLNGGCGIKPFIDLWILDKAEGADPEKRNGLLAKGELLKFTEVARRLADVWFGNAEHDELTLKMESFVLSGGVYGSSENRISVVRKERGGRLKYALSMIILPYDSIKYIYPVLKKHRFLTPVMQVHRWVRLLLGGRLRRARRALALNNSVSDEQVAQVHRFLGEVGLL